MKQLTLLFCLLLAANAAYPQLKAVRTPTGRGMWEFLPPGYQNSSEKFPLIIDLHGGDEKGNGSPAQLNKLLVHGLPYHLKTANSSQKLIGGAFPCVVLAPQLRYEESAWATQIIDSLFQYAQQAYKVDPDRLYLTGYSMGGGGVWRYASTYPQRLAGIVVICGVQSPTTGACQMAKAGLPIWAFHGEKDKGVPVQTTIDWVNAINSCKPTPLRLAQKTIFPDVGHNAWTYAYDPAYKEDGRNMYEWLLQFSTGGRRATNATGLRVITNRSTLAELNTASDTVALVANITSSVQPVKIIWERLTGSQGAMLHSPEDSLLLVSGLKPGRHLFKVTVRADSLVSENLLDVLVRQVAKKPIFHQGTSKQYAKIGGKHNQSFFLDAAFLKPSAQAALYKWELAEGPPSCLIAQPGSARTEVKFTSTGTYTFKLTAIDSASRASVGTVSVEVESE